MTYRSEKWQCLGFGGTSFSSCRHRHRRRLLFLFKLQSRNLKRESYYSSQCEPEFRLKNSSRLSSASAVIVVGVVFVIVAGLCCAKLFSPFSVIFMANFKFISLCKSEWECEWMCKRVCVCIAAAHSDQVHSHLHSILIASLPLLLFSTFCCCCCWWFVVGFFN